MQTKLSKNLLLTFLVLTMLLALSACQSDTDSDEPASDESAQVEEEAAVEEEAVVEEEAAVEEDRVFKIWYYEEGAVGESWAKALEDFQAAHPDVTVEFEKKTFEQIQQTAQMILNTDEVPDVMEINKGNATAGLYAKQGLLTDLTDEAAARGWDELLGTSLQTTARYDEQGIMGSGPLYGVTTYGEFVMVYYNKDMFAEYGLEVPTSLEEYEAVADAFVEADITPVAVGAGSVWPVTQNFYELLLYEADREVIEAYQLFKSDVDFHGETFTFGAETFADHVARGYFGDNANGIVQDDATAGFAQGDFPMILTGSWQFATYQEQITDFDWGVFLMPGKTFYTGSGGNLLAVPENAQNKDLAYEFLELTLGADAQTLMANSGGIPINADISQIENDKSRELNEAFAAIVANDGLSFYPDWPVPGYGDVLGGGLQELIAGSITPDEFLDQIAVPWKDYQETLEE